MSNTVLFVRIGPKTGPEKFFRCAIQFARTWKRVEVDGATAERLRGEQMLQVTSTRPADYVEEGAEATAVPVLGAAVPVLGDLVKAALIEKAQAIADADGQKPEAAATAAAQAVVDVLADAATVATAGTDATDVAAAGSVAGDPAADKAQTPAPAAVAKAKPAPAKKR